jgi:hypothetical protein
MTYSLLLMAIAMAKSATSQTALALVLMSPMMAVSTSASISSTAVCPRSLLLLYINTSRVYRIVPQLLLHTFPPPWAARKELFHPRP